MVSVEKKMDFKSIKSAKISSYCLGHFIFTTYYLVFDFKKSVK